MSKKQKVVDAQVEEQIAEGQNEISQGVVAEEVKTEEVKTEEVKQEQNNKPEQVKKAKDGKDKKKKDKKKDKNGGIGKKTKETLSELKKVTWPSFGEVCKKTGIVIAFTLLFGLFLFGVNTLLGYLSGLLA